MLGHRDMSMDDYVGILRRRKWLIAIPAILGPIVGYGVSLTLPEKYTSQTLVLVEQQKVPEKIVASVVNDGLNERLATMKEQILSRTRLEPIIEQGKLYEDQRKKMSVEDMVAEMRTAILVTPVASAMAGGKVGVSGFSISFTADDPQKAQSVCRQITSMFIEENLLLRESRSNSTTKFLRSQLEEAKRKLDEQDTRLAEFKQRHVGLLPGQEGANLNVLMSSNVQLEAVTQLINRNQQDKTYAESVLMQQIAAWESSQTGTNPQTMDQQLSVLQNQLLTLEGRYTLDHPDVKKTKADIAQMKSKIEEVNTAANQKAPEKAQKAALVEPPQIQQLRNQIRLYDQVIKEKTREQERLQQQTRVYQGRVSISPVVEQQHKELTRDYATAQGFYDELLIKMKQSEIATALETQSQGEQFRVMDPANLPEKPTFPNRPLFAAGGLGGGLALGLGIALLLEMKDKALRTEADIEFYLELPALALLPSLDQAGKQQGGFLKRQKAERA